MRTFTINLDLLKSIANGIKDIFEWFIDFVVSKFSSLLPECLWNSQCGDGRFCSHSFDSVNLKTFHHVDKCSIEEELVDDLGCNRS